ncbi:MAG: alpha/beta hydrolase-fold protein [Bacteroidota bacterium]
MNFPSFLRQLLGAFLHRGPEPIVRTHHINSSFLQRTVELDVYRPAILPTQPLKLVLFNDGQDLRRMDVSRQLGELYAARHLSPTLVVGMVAGDRMREYGTSERPDYKNRGDLARAYEQFVTDELMPWLSNRYLLHGSSLTRAVAGFSLGGLNAFDLVWRNPDHFSVAGVFSGALWWRARAFQPKDPDADRIIHTYVAAASEAPAGFRSWIMAGTEDEQEDRNNNGIIDAIDDSTDLRDLLLQKGLADPYEVCYFEVQGGQHHPDTWQLVFKDFMRWTKF